MYFVCVCISFVRLLLLIKHISSTKERLEHLDMTVQCIIYYILRPMDFQNN